MEELVKSTDPHQTSSISGTLDKIDIAEPRPHLIYRPHVTLQRPAMKANRVRDQECDLKQRNNSATGVLWIFAWNHAQEENT
jgi:hypothetical protein